MCIIYYYIGFSVILKPSCRYILHVMVRFAADGKKIIKHSNQHYYEKAVRL